jgi:hypothetical protein
MAGKRVFGADVFILNAVIDDFSDDGANAKLKALRSIALAQGGSEIAASAPMALRGTPFTNFNVEERRTTTRNLPTNSISPHSKVAEVARAVRAFLARNQAELDAHGIHCGIIYLAVGTQGVCCEPLLYWEDALSYQHNRVTEISDLNALAGFAQTPPATVVAQRLRKELTALFTELGCSHVQIGKTYPYLATRQPVAQRFVTDLKRLLDPHNLINRGALGFVGLEA